MGRADSSGLVGLQRVVKEMYSGHALISEWTTCPFILLCLSDHLLVYPFVHALVTSLSLVLPSIHLPLSGTFFSSFLVQAVNTSPT